LRVQLAENHLLFGREDVVVLGICGYRRRFAVLSGSSNTAESNAKDQEKGISSFSGQG